MYFLFTSNTDLKVDWHHRLNKFQQAPGHPEGQEGSQKTRGSQKVRPDWATEMILLSTVTTKFSK